MIQSLLLLLIFIVITIICLRVDFHKHQAWSSSLVLESFSLSNFSWCYFNKSNNGLVFVKTHKTSSSTLSRLIVINLCERKGRKCFLPSFDNPGRTWDLRKERDYKYASKEAPYEVWANHVIAPQLVRKLMVPKSFFISICRDPSLRFRSAYNWYQLDKQFGKSLSQFIEILNHTAVGSASHQYTFKYRTGLDSVSEELMGLEESRSGSETGSSFSLLLKKILTSQYYILVSDRFDESLLILGQFLGLEVSDLIYKKQKVTPIEELIVLSEAQREVLVRHQPQDSALFKGTKYFFMISSISPKNNDVISIIEIYNVNVLSIIVFKYLNVLTTIDTKNLIVISMLGIKYLTVL